MAWFQAIFDFQALLPEDEKSAKMVHQAYKHWSPEIYNFLKTVAFCVKFVYNNIAEVI